MTDFDQSTTVSAVSYDEPVMHAVTGANLPAEHWLMVEWEGDLAVPQVVVCEHCGRDIYDRAGAGTLCTWIETGRILLEEGEPTAQVWCLECFASNASVWPDLYEWWGLVFGGPQPFLDISEPVTRAELRALARANAATLTPPEVPE